MIGITISLTDLFIFSSCCFLSYSDQEVWGVLEGVGMKSFVVEGMSAKLLEDVGEGGGNLSAVQCQVRIVS